MKFCFLPRSVLRLLRRQRLNARPDTTDSSALYPCTSDLYIYKLMTPSTVSRILVILVVMATVTWLLFFSSNTSYNFDIGHLLPVSRDTFQKSSKPARPWWQDVLCKRRGIETDPRGHKAVPMKLLRSDVTPEENQNVFLMDTSCNPMPTYRAWCSVESWARNNPDRQVWFLLTSDWLEDVGGLTSNLLQQYTNLQVVTADVYDLFIDTPLLPLFESRKWTLKKSWPIELLSDMLRVLVLWHWGGVYSDTDIINLRRLTLPPNSLGFENSQQIGSSFYSFHARHPTLLKLMKHMQEDFKPYLWGCIGPRAITRVMAEECGKDLEKLGQEAPVTCPRNITLHPTTTFSPLVYTRFREYFNPGGGKNFDKKYESAFGIHFWNKKSKTMSAKVNSSSVYEVAARKFCPVTYQSATAHSNVF